MWASCAREAVKIKIIIKIKKQCKRKGEKKKQQSQAAQVGRHRPLTVSGWLSEQSRGWKERAQALLSTRARQAEDRGQDGTGRGRTGQDGRKGRRMGQDRAGCPAGVLCRETALGPAATALLARGLCLCDLA